MKKILITSMLAIITSLTVYFVGFWQPKEHTDNLLSLENSKVVEDNSTKEDINKDINKEDNVDKSVDINNNEEENKKEDINNNSLIDDNKTNKDYLNNSNTEENKNSNSTYTDKKGESHTTNAKIFNIEKEEIIDRLSLGEKTKLFTIAKKISTVDVEKIKDSLKENGEKEGIIEVVRVLKRRLKSDDYNEVKNILSPYINIEFLESMV